MRGLPARALPHGEENLMTEFKPFLKQLISLPGLSGYEGPVREAITEAWKPLVDELTVSRMGSLHALKKGAAEPVDGAPRPRILLAAHMDAIGLMVTGIAPGGFLRIFRIGGVDPRILPGMPVMVYAKRELPGIIVQPVDSLLPHSLQNKPVRMEYLLVDTGLEAEEVRALVRPGDLISFATPPTELTGDTLSGHSLDNRASVAARDRCAWKSCSALAMPGMFTAWRPYRKRKPCWAVSPRPSRSARRLP